MPADLTLGALRDSLVLHVDGIADVIEAPRICGGRSNSSWLIASGGDTSVLRANPAPVAELVPSAHAIEREYRVQSALASPAEVEQVLFGHEAVREVCVIRTSHKRRGESVKAVIVLKDGFERMVTEDEVISG